MVAIPVIVLLGGPFASAAVDYLRDVKPLLKEKCFSCHGALKQKAGLRLDTGKLIRQGGKSGPAVLAGKPDESRIIDTKLVM